MSADAFGERRRKIFVVAGEKSGDELGARLIDAIQEASPGAIFKGVGGDAMARRGFDSLFPLSDIAVNGLSAVVRRLPLLMRRLDETTQACLAMEPDVFVAVDAPDFTHRIAKRIRARAPQIKIVDYVSPMVWAWRGGRAKKMRAYIDLVLALFPFEPSAYRRLSGPPCLFVGHPLVEGLGDLRPNAQEAALRESKPLRLIVMPGSRAGEVQKLAPIFGQALHLTMGAIGPCEIVLPVVAQIENVVRDEVAKWPFQPRLLMGEAAKFEAFRTSNVALAASGTASLELALAGTPMVVGYKVSPWEEKLKFLVDVPSVVISNLVLGANIVPEFLHGDCTPEKLASALRKTILPGVLRERQQAAFQNLPNLLTPASGMAPSRAAAAAILQKA